MSPTTSGSAPARVVTGMQPASIPSATDRPNPSWAEACTYTDARRYQSFSTSSSTQPVSVTFGVAASRSSSAAPSSHRPASTNSTSGSRAAA